MADAQELRERVHGPDAIVAALRERVHGLTAARSPKSKGGPAPKPIPAHKGTNKNTKPIPKGGTPSKVGKKSAPAPSGGKASTWDESPAGKGWNEKKVVRDTDPGEEGQFDFKDKSKSKGGGGGGSSKKSGAEKAKRDAERAAEKAERNKREAQAFLAKPVPKTEAARQALVERAIKEGWQVDQAEDGSGTITTPEGVFELPATEALEENVKKREREAEKAGRESARAVQAIERDNERAVAAKQREQRDMYKRSANYVNYRSKAAANGRMVAAVEGKALPDGAFPILSSAHWYQARAAFDRIEHPGLKTRVAMHLKKRGEELGISEDDINGVSG